MKKAIKAGTQKEALEEKAEGSSDNASEEAMESGDAGAPNPTKLARRYPMVKPFANNFTPKGRK